MENNRMKSLTRFYCLFYIISFFKSANISFSQTIVTELIDSGRDAGLYCAIAVDNNGFSHISYQDYNNNNPILKYAYEDQSGWHIEEIDNTDWAGYYSDIIIDSNGNPHIVEIIGGPRGGAEVLRYLKRDGDIWIAEDLTHYDAYQYCKITLDSQGRPNIAYGAWSDSDRKWRLVHSIRMDVWQNFTITTKFDRHMNWRGNCDIVMDKYDGCITSYFEDGNLFLFESNNYTIIEENTGRGYGSSLCYNPDTEDIWIAYGNRNTKQLKIAQKNDNSLNVYSIDNLGGEYPTICLEKLGNPHVVYYTGDGSNQQHFRYAFRDESGWHKLNVDEDFSHGFAYSGISINPIGQARICYYWHDNLYYAKDTAPTYIEPIDILKSTKSYSHFYCFPNPFNSQTTLTYFIPNRNYVTLDVFNIAGEKVVTLVNNYQDAGNQSVTWDGRGDKGQILASGIYLGKIQAGSFKKTIRILFQK